MADITIVIVTPHQSDILRHLQACVIYIQHLFIRDEHLGYFCDILTGVLCNHIPLSGQDICKHGLLLLRSVGTVHLSVVKAAHTEGIDYWLACRFLNSLFPEPAYFLTIADPIVLACCAARPFYRSTAQKRLTMGRAHINAVFFSNLTITGSHEERICNLMHCRPECIGTQPKQKFKNLLMSLRAYLTLDSRRLIILAAPWHHAPILVIDKYTTVLHTRALLSMETRREEKRIHPGRSDICPPFPR